MTASAKSIKGSSQGVDYLIAEHKGYELDRNLLYGETSTEIMQSFRMQQSENVNCQKKFITAYISPDPKDGQKLTDKELKEISQDFMRRIGVDPEKQAYLAIVHTERNHKHVHLLINRIVGNKTAMKDNYLVLKSHDAVHKIAKERGLISAKDIMEAKRENALNQFKEIKQKMFEAHKQVMSLKPKSISKYMEYMKSVGYEIKPTINRAGKLQGFRIKERNSENEFKLSDVKRSISSEVQKTLKYDLVMTEKTSRIFEAHKKVMKLNPQSSSKYTGYMNSLGYDVSIIKNKTGKITDLGIYKSEKLLESGTKDLKIGVADVLQVGKKKTFTQLKEEFLKNRTYEFSLDIEIRQIMATQIEEISKLNLDKNLNNSKSIEI